MPADRKPGVALFIGAEDLQARVQRVERALGPLTYIGTAEPGLLDRTLHWLNPVNRNVAIAEYAIGVNPEASDR